MSEDKQDKLFIKLKNYNKEREAILDKALEKSEKGEKLTQSEIEVIREHFPNEEELKKMTEKMSGLSKALEGIVQPQMEIVKTISDNIDEITKPITDSITSFGKGLQKALQPVFDELENQYKENPLTRKEIEEGSEFFKKYVKDKEKTIQEIIQLDELQKNLLSKIFEQTEATEEDIVKYKLESEEVDLPSNIFIDISRKLQGKETTRTNQRDFVFKQLRVKLSKNIYNKITKLTGEETEEELNQVISQNEWKKIEKAIKEIKEETFFFEKRPSRLELDHIDIEKEIQKEKPLKYILYQATDIHFENISEEDFKKYLQEEIEILKKAIKLRKKISSYNNEIMTIFSRASNPYFEGKREEELEEKDRKLKEGFYNTSFALFQNSTNLEKLFTNIFLKRTPFEQLDIERQERFFEFLRYSLEDLEDLQKEWTPQEEVEEVVEQYLTTNSSDRKILTTEKIVPQLMLSGLKIQNKFTEREQGKIEKVTFDLSSDNDKKFFIQVFMKEYRIPFTDDTFKTLESLMTIQNLMEKKFGTLKGINFSTKDIIFLNKGGRVTNYSKDLLQKTNRELISLMSAIGSLDTTEYFYKYYEIDDQTIEEENEAIFKQINTNEEWEKKLDELRKEKIKKLPEDKKIPIEKIKKISTLQPFVNLKGIEIESDEEAYNNTFWKFNDIDEKPIPIFEFLKITGRFASLPLEMDSYLTDSTINNEVTRNLKTIIANLNYFKTNKSMKKDKTKKNFLEYYFEGTLEGETKQRVFEPFEAMQILKTKEKKLIGQWKFKATRTIDSIAKDCKFDEERGIGIPKQWKHNKEKLRFIDSIVDYLRKAKEDKNIDDFILYTSKDKVVKNEDYITENEKRSQKTKDKIRGKKTKTKQTKNPTIEKISVIIK